MAKKKIRVGLIGCGGNMRNAHIPRLQADGAVDLVAVADTAEEPARLLMEKWGAETGYYTDFRRMIRNEALDTVMISSRTRPITPRCAMGWSGGCTCWWRSP